MATIQTSPAGSLAAAEASQRRYRVLDVFGTGPCSGNPLAVVVDGEGLTGEQMQSFANWTNLSETTFLLPPSMPEADYRVRIFTPVEELAFAGHPTLGSCRAWLSAGNKAAASGRVVQECEAGLIELQVDEKNQSFRAPDLVRSGPPADDELAPVLEGMGLEPSQVLAAEWVDNGPGWLGLLLDSIDTLHSLRPSAEADFVGALAFYPGEGQPVYDVRAFFPGAGVTLEDPVTGSLQASLAQWMLHTGRVVAPYKATQGQMLGRRGEVQITTDDQGAVWVGGTAEVQVTGTVSL